MAYIGPKCNADCNGLFCNLHIISGLPGKYANIYMAFLKRDNGILIADGICPISRLGCQKSQAYLDFKDVQYGTVE